MPESKITGAELVGRLLAVEAFAVELVAEHLAMRGASKETTDALLARMMARAKELVAELGDSIDPVTKERIREAAAHADQYVDRFVTTVRESLGHADG